MNPKHLKPQAGLTDTQRKSLGLPRTPARIREPGEATSVVIANSTTREPYRTGYGEVPQPMRAGSMRAHELPSRGYRT